MRIRIEFTVNRMRVEEVCKKIDALMRAVGVPEYTLISEPQK
jgi:hypothetical protein